MNRFSRNLEFTFAKVALMHSLSRSDLRPF
jgi:hypothetical protein